MAVHVVLLKCVGKARVRNLGKPFGLDILGEMAPLGKVPDSLAAYWTGRSPNAVAKTRNGLGIPPARGPGG